MHITKQMETARTRENINNNLLIVTISTVRTINYKCCASKSESNVFRVKRYNGNKV